MNETAALFQILADSTRLRILFLLRELELSVGELAQVLALGQPSISKHLKVLLDGNFVVRRKEGNWVFIGLGDPDLVEPVFTLLDGWDEVIGVGSLRDADKARLTAIQTERAEEAAQYFRAHAADWSKVNQLHAASETVEAAILKELAGHRIGRLVDIGTGTGTMLTLFRDRAEHMIGIDRSPDMLRFGRARLSEAGIANAELRQGDMSGLVLPSASADTVILHQVLHYARYPAVVVAEAARLLAPGGRLVIVDVAPHEREELRRDHAHARLGFADEEVLGYLRAADLDASVADHLTGGALTVTIWSGKPRQPRLRAVQ